jgi:molybdenum cofactor cytidylyltransferase
LVRALALEIQSSRSQLDAVVVGHAGAHVGRALTGLPLVLLENPQFVRGIAASIHVAVAWAETAAADALILCACDQPRLTAGHVDALVEALGDGSSAVASAYRGVLGIPAGFAAPWFQRLRELEGDRGAGPLLRRSAGVREIAWEDGAFDVDTELDAARLRAEDRGTARGGADGGLGPWREP